MPDVKTPIAAVILTRGKTALLKNCLDSLAISEGVTPEVVVVEHETEEALSVDLTRPLFPTVSYFRRTDSEAGKESFASLNNFGVEHTKANYICLINNDVVMKADTLAKMAAVLDERSDVGIVGAKLIFPQGTLQHIGVVLDGFGVPRHLGWGRQDGPEYEPSMRSDYFDAVTFALVMIRREVWDAVGGLDTDYHFNFEDIDFCLKARRAGWRSYTTVKAVAYHFESQSSKHRQHYDCSVPRNLKVFRDKWIISGEMEKVLKIHLQRDFGPLQFERPNIAFVPAGQYAGISWWRINQPMAMLAEKKLANVQAFHATTAETKVMEIVSLADLVVWQGHHHQGIKRMAAMGEERSFRMVYEYDDHPVYMSPFAQAYRVFGCKEVQIAAKDGEETWLWRDGQDGFDMEQNRLSRQTQLEIMALSDGLTTTTEPLVAYFRTLNPYVFLLPNCINFEMYKPASDLFERKPGPTRIGWWGGDNHWHDISIVGEALVNYVNSHDVKLVLLGAFYKGPLKGIDMNKVEDYP